MVGNADIGILHPNLLLSVFWRVRSLKVFVILYKDDENKNKSEGSK